MYFYVIFVVVLFLNLSATQNDEAPAETLSDVICKTCVCAEESVNCSNKDIQEAFKDEDWKGVNTVSPIEVDLSGNRITSLPRFPELPIQNLNLSSCEIERLEPACFMYLGNLTSLDLSRNKITTNSISKKILVGLVVANKDPRPFYRMRYISLAHNDIHALPQDLFDFMIEITHLDLSGNPLAYLDQVTMAAITGLTTLKVLKLSDCDLETLPEGLLRRQRRLEHLDLSANKFTTIPATVGDAPNLVHLNFDKNPIEKLEERTAISNLTKLQELHLCRLSKLQSIGAGALGGLGNLLILYLNYNPRLTNLDPAFLMWEDDEMEKWPLLSELYLNNNNLSEINSHLLDRWDKLVNVDFTNNPYVCDCSNQWMVDVLIPLISTTEANGTAVNMICKKPSELRGMTFAQLHGASKTLDCPNTETASMVLEPDTIILLGIMIGIFATFPIVLILILLWRRGYFAQCRGKLHRKDYDDDRIDAL